MVKLYHKIELDKKIYLGPSIKFVLPIIDAFPDKKNGGNFLCGKKGHNGGGGGGPGGFYFLDVIFPVLVF